MRKQCVGFLNVRVNLTEMHIFKSVVILQHTDILIHLHIGLKNAYYVYYVDLL